MDHRRVQRTLFRMQLDAAFASSLRAGDTSACRDLGPQELAMLRDASPAAVSADRDGKRRAQFLGNVSSEFALSIAAGLDVTGFTASVEFHEAVQRDASLPLALARFASRCTPEALRPLRALLALECTMVRARRELRPGRAPAAGEVVLAPWIWIVELPSGTLALASRLREALDKGAEGPAAFVDAEGYETLLVRSSSVASPFRLRVAEVEHASPALAALLRAACEPATRAALAAALSTERDEIDPIIDGLVADGVLLAA